jgi:ABC-type sugar transport system ATPase subunit
MKSLKLKNLTVKFGSKTVLNSLNLDIGSFSLKYTIEK